MNDITAVVPVPKKSTKGKTTKIKTKNGDLTVTSTTPYYETAEGKKARAKTKANHKEI